MSKIPYALGFAALLMLSTCRLSETRNVAPKQSADLFVRYLQPEKEYKAEAILLEGDSLPFAKPIPFPGGIRFMDKDMAENQVAENMIRHAVQFSGDFSPQATFSFKDKTNSSYSIPLSMEALGEFNFTMPNSPEGQVSLNIKDGGTLGLGESLVLVLTDQSGQASTVTIEGPSTSGEYAFPLVSFGNPAKGAAEIYLVKKQVRNEQKGKLNVHLVEELYSASAVVRVP